MNIDYSYVKKRSEFGSSYLYANDGPTIVDSVQSDRTLADRYLVKSYMDKGTQESPIMSLNEVNTWRVDFAERGMFHDQGGWPKDLNVADDEAVLRYRKKLEREDNYIASMKMLTKPIEHAILQNNAINIYELYFSNVIMGYSSHESHTQIRNIYRDPGATEEIRPVSHVSWSPDRGTKFAVSYCNTKYHMRENIENTATYVWNVEIPNSPETTFESDTPIVNLEWNTIEDHLLVGGLYDGRIAVYDTRRPPNHIGITKDMVSHRDPVHSILWIHSKTGTEFFSTSADGMVKWWDCRRLNKVLDSIILDFSRSQSLTNSYSASCLDFDPSIPAKYLVGTETGHVICGNRKGATLSEKLPWILRASTGPIYSLMRNQAFSKIFMSVADWAVRIWSEECKESPVMWIKNYKHQLTCGEWSKTRYSVFCTSRSDGYLDVWDLLLDQKHAVATQKVSKEPLTTLRMEERGHFLCVGDEAGTCFLIQLGENLTTCAKNDKNYLSAMFDRENRREKILEGRMREIKLALKLKAQQAEDAKEMAEASASELTGTLKEVLKMEEEYWEEVERNMASYKETTKKKEVKGQKEEEKEEQQIVIPVKEEVEQSEAVEPLPPE